MEYMNMISTSVIYLYEPLNVTYKRNSYKMTCSLVALVCLHICQSCIMYIVGTKIIYHEHDETCWTD